MTQALPPTYFLVAVILAVALHLAFPVLRFWTVPLSLVGIVPLILGIVLNLTADHRFKQYQTTVKPFEQSASLVTEFPFSISRNPMYLGLTLMLLGVALLLGSVSSLVPVLLFPYVMNYVFIRQEEQQLAATFGTDWERYSSRVRRWI
ncbi:MAG: isoprenylcysteine carboxylmethyltransferase family protein [Gemmatimonadota bacterium]|nr:MAG: isoprenylcysteine carboxylmethyltransferase family protein [Gemmatimonadota bacterium]